ncbi:hypothetical protein [Lysinibacillus fusiformis]|nr:hypothetical protein [Lysinibacillus fusiformis]
MADKTREVTVRIAKVVDKTSEVLDRTAKVPNKTANKDAPLKK